MPDPSLPEKANHGNNGFEGKNNGLNTVKSNQWRSQDSIYNIIMIKNYIK